MQDRVSLYPGRVKLEPVAGQANTYDLTRADQSTQEGTPLSKATLLKDATAAMFGLDANAVPDNALELLSRFHKGLGNEYVWGKQAPTYTEEVLTDQAVSLQSSVGWTLYYANCFHVENGKFVFDEQSTLYLTSDNWNLPSTYNVLKGKYYITNSERSYIFKVPQDATFSFDGEYIRVSERTTLQNPGLSDTYVGYVNSPDPNAYPPAVSDGYTYTPLGQLGAKVQIATGSYAGTGTYGSRNKNSLTFPFFPKAVFIIDSQLAYFVERGGSLAWLGQSGAISGNNTCSFILTGKTLSWYCNENNLGDSPTNIQCNASGAQYFYIAIG